MKPFLVALAAGIVTFLTYYFLFQSGNKSNNEVAPILNTDIGDLTKTNEVPHEEMNEKAEKIEALRQKLQPHNIVTINGTVTKHQFLHLHHMKTGGTSMDGLINCAMGRLKRDLGYNVNYMNIHECSETRYERCLSGEDTRCRSSIDNAALMSYCAPLKDLQVFNWKNGEEERPISAVTVLRHPVARVWSMFRFQTKRCYECRPLKNVYADFDEMDEEEISENMCAQQLMNHQTRNLITKVDGTDEEKVAQAIEDMHSFFTMVGLTEDMSSTATIVGKVFPWLAESVNGTSTKCSFPHRNSSPSNNRCGPGGTHWDLPDEPDAETAQLIMQHNQLDMKVYEAAVELFELQKKALVV